MQVKGLDQKRGFWSVWLSHELQHFEIDDCLQDNSALSWSVDTRLVLLQCGQTKCVFMLLSLSIFQLFNSRRKGFIQAHLCPIHRY